MSMGITGRRPHSPSTARDRYGMIPVSCWTLLAPQGRCHSPPSALRKLVRRCCIHLQLLASPPRSSGVSRSRSGGIPFPTRSSSSWLL